MVSSMRSPFSRARHHLAGGCRLPSVAAIVVLVLLVSVGAPGNAAAGTVTVAPAPAAAVKCTSQPPQASVIATIPWAQARYDLAALSQITEGAGRTIAVIDSGVDAANPHLANAVKGGGDLLDSTGTGIDDCIGHGTAVASIIAARPVAGAGLRGLAPAASILSLRVSERIENEDGMPTGAGNVQALIDGIRRAVTAKPKPDVINLSISTAADNAALRSAVQAALDADIVVVAAVGNQYARGNPTPYPASYDGVVGVGAIGQNGIRLPVSQVGPYVDIVAPGEAIVGAAPRSGHLVRSGTSFATPFVAATAALIRARYPQLTRTDVVRRLLATADPAAGGQPSPDYGYGVVNPLRALTEVVPPLGVVAVASPTPVIEPGVVGANQISGPTALALGAAVILLLATVVVATLAAATPLGRRRRWRPGTVDTTPIAADEQSPPSLFGPTPLPPQLTRRPGSTRSQTLRR
jgi:membrane-anchored mycosin MYCP